MSEENEQAQDDVAEPEDTSTEEVQDFSEDTEDTVTIPKSKFNAIRRKASAYDAKKDKPQAINRSTDEKWKQEMELKVLGYKDIDELNFIMKNGGLKALENGYIKSAIDSMRQQKVAEAAVVANEGNKSSSEKGLDPSTFSKLSAEEQLKALSSLS